MLEWVHPEYLYYKYQGDAVKAQAIKARCERVEDVLVSGLTDAALFGGGIGNALGNNLTLGVVPRGDLSAPAFVYGQQVGDGLSMGIGALEVHFGNAMTDGGKLMLVVPGGAAVASPLVAGGVAVTGHGSVVMSKALLEFAKHKKGKYKGRKHSDKVGIQKLKTPKGNLSGKQASKDIPGWMKGLRPKIGESGKDFAKRLMDDKYGPGNYKRGPKTEFSKIQKWADRNFE